MYTISPSNGSVIAKQTSGSNITSTSSNYNGGVAIGFTPPAGSLLTGSVALGNPRTVYGSKVVKNKNVFGAYRDTGVVITSVADNGSGKCRFTKNSHGLTVGTYLMIDGSTASSLKTIHRITAVATNTFDTDVAYVASGTAGTYYPVKGNFATLTERNYVIRGGVDNNLAGTGTNVGGGFGSDFGHRRSIHKLEASRLSRTATAIRAGYWHVYSGTWTTKPTDANDISTMGTDQAATPTRAIPGELVYRVSGQPDATNGVKQVDYPAKTQ